MRVSTDILVPLAAGFAAPGLAIAGVLLAGIPIIIHILNRRRHKTVSWAAMQYLLEALRRNRRRLQFENWVLLLMRCLAVLLIAFALARPLGCSEATAGRFAGQASRLHVIVLDNSASMAYQVDEPNARTCLERGKRIAEGLLGQLGSGDAVCIVSAAHMADAATPIAPTYDVEACRTTLAQLPQTYTNSDLPAALKRAVAIADENGEFTSRRLYLITDATRPAWQDPTIADALKQYGRQLEALYEITHIDVGEPLASNAGVGDLRMLSGIVTTAMPVDFAANVQVSGASSSSLIWQSGTRVLGTAAAQAISADRPEQLLPQITFANEGLTAIVARLEPADRLPEDDARGLAFSVRKRLNVLVAQSDPGWGALQSPGTFLQLALAPNNSDEDAAKVEIISETELSSRPLQERDALVIAAPSAISPADAQQIRRYVEDGGTLVVIMGEGTNIELVNTVLAPEGLMPGTITSIMNTGEGQEPYRFDFRPDGDLHPLLRVFRGQQNSGLTSARVWTYAHVDLDPQRHVERVLDLVGGDPMMTLHSLGRGKVAFIATSADIRWSTLPAKTAFVALMHELLLGTVHANDGWRNLPAGTRLAIPRGILEGNQPMLADPAGRAVVLEPGDESAPQIASQSVPLQQPGLYRLQIDGRSFPVAVTFPSAESDLTHVDAPAIRRALGDIELRQTTNELSAEYAAADDQGDFSWPILLVALALLASESFLAMWFRR